MKLLACSTCALALAACGGDVDDGHMHPDDDAPVAREFTLRVENIAPWTVLKASAQRAKTTLVEGNAGPGEAFEIRFTAGAGHSVSFAAMLSESNDWFFAPDPAGIPLYINGVPSSGDVTSYVRLWDAGTEADQEPGVGDATGVNQTTRDAGTPDADRRVRLVPDTMTLSSGTMFARPAVDSMIRVTLTPNVDRQFTLRIENRSTETTLTTSAGTRAIHVSPVAWAVHRVPGALFDADAEPRDNGLEMLAEAGQPDSISSALRYHRGIATPLSRGVFVVHRGAAPLFALGAPDPGRGFERLAEDGDATPIASWLQSAGAQMTTVGTLDTPVGVEAPGAAAPGQAYEVTFVAEPGDKLSFATMFAASNDWFFAPSPDGIELFLDNQPRWGDVTSEVRLYDLGTENDEELDIGPNTAPQQSAPNTGRVDRITEIREVTIDRYEVPEVLHLRVTLTPAAVE